MASGFKSSLFGFKKKDVIDYIEQSHKNSAEKEAELLSEIDTLKAEICELKNEICSLIDEKERLENIQEEYIKRYSELERLSEDIGKLYLTAQTNAKEVMEKSLEERELVSKEIETNLTTIEEMHASLGAVKNDILSSVGNFSDELDRLFEEFSKAKSKLNNNS